jgi:hypothetical protein
VLCLPLGALAQAPAEQRIPRQTAPRTGAIQGVIRTMSGLGLGGVRIDLLPATGGEILTPCPTGGGICSTGDGAFRIRNLPPGRYNLTGTLAGYRTLIRSGIDVVAGQVTSLEDWMEAIPPPGEAIPPPPDPPSVYRNYPIPQMPAGISVAPPAISALPPREEVFVPMQNRWGYDFPNYRRYGPLDSNAGDIQYMRERWYDPFNLNRLKGDYPIWGQRTFLQLTLASDTFADGRRLPLGSGVSGSDPDNEEFFRNFGQFFLRQNFSFGVDLFHGDTAFRPFDWRVKFTPEININYLKVRENGVVNIDVRKGTTRLDTQVGLQEAFVEKKLFDIGHTYDFVSVRAGIQTFNSDFKGFIFFDQEPGLRLFGNLKANRYQYNAAYFAMLEKDTNSGLNSMAYRGQQVFIANLYKQDFLKLGYTIQVSFHYNKDEATLKYDNNRFLVRPAAIGLAAPHKIRAYYTGFAGDGHIGRINITHAFYQVNGYDSGNLLTRPGQRVDINAQMAALEASIDKDWVRIRGAFYWASGDDNPRDKDARGFDAIMDNPNFAGGIFSLWNREGIRLTSTGAGLVQDNSFNPSLRSSKIQGQANYVNPGLFLYNGGVDFEVTPKMKGIVNFSALMFHQTAPLELLLFQKPVGRGIGADTGLGVVYRPALTDNMVITAGFNIFSPFQGFRDIYRPGNLYSGFTNVRFQF